ncbi:MAG TPA: cyclase family protein [Bacteroidia bacterium]|nr:cyclase family protein [Bacteroidia bacterium]HRC32185.1 cyclase family protein [Bacteroidia bacterium]
MFTKINFNNKTYSAQLNDCIDISIPLRAGADNVNAWWAAPVTIEAVRTETFIGDVNQGGSVNFRNVALNPHGNGTHTECVGHISKEPYTINQCLKHFFFVAQLITVTPSETGNRDKVILSESISKVLMPNVDAVILRTLPNDNSKLTRQYSGTNFAYVQNEVMEIMVKNNVQHFLIDLPSVDREFDDGKLQAHHTFWQYPHATRTQCTITEMVYIENKIEDGIYLLNLQITALENDATPSKPVLFRMVELS